MLPERDDAYLRDLGFDFDVTVDGGVLCTVIHNFVLPEGYEPRVTDLLLRLPAGFPDAAPDMFWCDPPIGVLRTGTYPQAADQMETYLDRTWQRFSRHLAPGMWRPGTDDLRSFLTLIGAELARSLGEPR
jgi:hypothetical protein